MDNGKTPDKVVLKIDSTAAQNAAGFFEGSKKARAKRASLDVAYLRMQQKLKDAEGGRDKISVDVVSRPQPRPKEWFSRFHHFLTTSGKLAVGGKNATDNEFLVSRHLQEGDLFFHADVPGASAVILKGGKDASEKELEQAAQFAACYSRAWKAGTGAVDVYAVGKEAVGRTSQGEYVPKGGFMIRGGRKWFKNTPLMLALFESGGLLEAVPAAAATDNRKAVLVVPGETGKPEVAKLILKRLGLQADAAATEIESALPGPCSLG